MFFFAAITLIGLFWVYFFLPETSGRSLESMDAVFELPWWKVGRYGASVEVSPALFDGEDVGGEKEKQVEYLETARQGA
jgi:hypothetical protein